MIFFTLISRWAYDWCQNKLFILFNSKNKSSLCQLEITTTVWIFTIVIQSIQNIQTTRWYKKVKTKCAKEISPQWNRKYIYQPTIVESTNLMNQIRANIDDYYAFILFIGKLLRISEIAMLTLMNCYNVCFKFFK